MEDFGREAIVQVHKRGVFTLLNALREKHGIEKGETFRIVDLDGGFILTPMVAELAREIERARIEAGLAARCAQDTAAILAGARSG
ncbi:MAG: AbrB/MazE/SpoVT family DNA-binding domain-containing protein [Caldilinea sp.]|nr:AbrB/MazE/SpoVT family DNA-binding domain-containing protein [Anaerolineales bacterium]